MTCAYLKKDFGKSYVPYHDLPRKLGYFGGYDRCDVHHSNTNLEDSSNTEMTITTPNLRTTECLM